MNFFKSAQLPPIPAEPVAEVLNHTVHPFYPLGVEIVNYLANEKDVIQLLTSFASLVGSILLVAWYGATKFAPHLKASDQLAVLWFVLCGMIHFFFEGYFSYNHTRMGPAQDLFGQLWKEYALSDSRYLTSDPFVLCMETITAIFWGPLSFVMVYFIVTSHRYRYPLQAIVSLGQIYGDVLYYATCLFDHYHKSLSYCRPEAYYFWFYFFFMNFIWIVIPSSLLYDSIRTTGKAFKALERMSNSLKTNQVSQKPTANGHIKNA
ncbi:hypothetical protein B0A52_06043 [Exophiala mesophila]|uniref:EXPERA domain-containing protein n=1 Tax=Exophiala mesophila TaxID=212818 RepID=A0A438N571_EXOME|nr:hypothetical protein B0A52_06043 [Exophiala mesophila]